MLARFPRSRNPGPLAGEGSGRSGPSLLSTQVLVAGGLIAPIVFIALMLLDGLIQPGYNALTEYVSDLSWMSDGWIQVTSFIVSGWLLMGFSIALCRLADAGTAPKWAPVLIGFMGFGLIAAGTFGIDPTGGRLTLHGTLHYASTAVTGGSLALASVLAWRDGRRDRLPVKAALLSVGMGLACVSLFAASLVVPSAALPGLLERIALLIGAARIGGFARAVYPQHCLGLFRHEFERKGMAA